MQPGPVHPAYICSAFLADAGAARISDENPSRGSGYIPTNEAVLEAGPAHRKQR
jgi:hypothetical protein